MRELSLFSCHLEVELAFLLRDDVVQLILNVSSLDLRKGGMGYVRRSFGCQAFAGSYRHSSLSPAT
jgi:hypothetical protein